MRFLCVSILMITINFLAAGANRVLAQDDSPALTSPVDRTQELKLLKGDFGLADGPAWDGWSLWIPDVKEGKLIRYIPKQEKFQVASEDIGTISATFFSHDELYLSDHPDGDIAKWNKNKKVQHVSLGDQPSSRPNDLAVDEHGGIYVTMTRESRVLYIHPDKSVSVAVDNINTPNGIILNPSEDTLYVSAYAPKEVWSYQIVSPGKTKQPKKFATMGAGDEKGADGMTIDRAGNVYCAGPDGIWIWNSKGELLDKIRCPEKPINCTFGGQAMTTLFITGFGGLYQQPMNIAGQVPDPPIKRNWVYRQHKLDTTIPESVAFDLNLVYRKDGDRQVLADMFWPKHEQPKAAVVAIHGGGWKNGDKSIFRAMAIDLAKRGYVAMAIEYRLAREAHFPASIQDCFAAVRYLRAHADKYRLQGAKIFAVGGSAGGHLAGLMACGGSNEKLMPMGQHAEYSPKIDGAVVMAGPLQIVTGSVADRSRTQPNCNINLWVGKNIDEAHDMHRLADAHVQASQDTCPILFVLGEKDNPGRNELTRKKLESLGVRTELKVHADGEHGCWNRNPWFEPMQNDIDTFLQSLLD